MFLLTPHNLWNLSYLPSLLFIVIIKSEFFFWRMEAIKHPRGRGNKCESSKQNITSTNTVLAFMRGHIAIPRNLNISRRSTWLQTLFLTLIWTIVNTITFYAASRWSSHSCFLNTYSARQSSRYIQSFLVKIGVIKSKLPCSRTVPQRFSASTKKTLIFKRGQILWPVSNLSNRYR